MLLLILLVFVILCAPRGPPATMTGALVGGRGGFFGWNPTVAADTAARLGGPAYFCCFAEEDGGGIPMARIGINGIAVDLSVALTVRIVVDIDVDVVVVPAAAVAPVAVVLGLL